MSPSSHLKPERVLTPLGIGLALSLLGDTTLYAVLPLPKFAARAGISLAMVGIVLGLNRLVRIVFNGPAGYLFDRFPRRPIMLVSLLIGSISTAFYAISFGPTMMILGRILWGIAWSGMWIGANTMALDISHADNRGKINGNLQMWFYIGVFLSSLFGGLFTDLFTYRGGLWVSSALAFLGFLIWVKFLPETKITQNQPEPEVTKPNGLKNGFPWKTALSCGLAYFVIRFVFAGVLASTTILWLSQFVPESGLKLNGWAVPLASLTGFFIAVRVIISIISAPQIGFISDKFKKRWTVLVIILSIFGAGGLWLMSLPNFGLSFLGALLAAVSSGSVPAIIPAIIGDQVEEQKQSRTLGSVFTAGDLGSAIGPPIALSLIPILTLNTVYMGCALLYVFSALVLLGLAVREIRQAV